MQTVRQRIPYQHCRGNNYNYLSTSMMEMAIILGVDPFGVHVILFRYSYKITFKNNSSSDMLMDISVFLIAHCNFTIIVQTQTKHTKISWRVDVLNDSNCGNIDVPAIYLPTEVKEIVY
jgi:hypothetical protein